MDFDIIEDFPFMLGHSKHSEPFFSNLLGNNVVSGEIFAILSCLGQAFPAPVEK